MIRVDSRRGVREFDPAIAASAMIAGSRPMLASATEDTQDSPIGLRDDSVRSLDWSSHSSIDQQGETLVQSDCVDLITSIKHMISMGVETVHCARNVARR